ncbi:carbohydrate-binding domain-containing protein [bacterium]|nr:carbohydrate-binding domain-containing protein [bacterium]
MEAGDQDKVQIVLDGVIITNTDSPCIYVKTADKVFVTTTDSENTLEVIDEFVDDGETNTNGVIFSKEDITLNGVGTLTINSTKN